MSISNAEENITPVPETTAPPKPRRIWWIIGGIVFVLLIAAGGAYFGYQKAIQMRLSKQSEQVALEATNQFQLGLQDLTAKRYDIARQRFEYIIKLDPSFPGARDKLTEVMYLASITQTPTPAPTPTLTPTADLRGVEDLFNQAKQDLVDKKWSEAIDVMDNLRKQNLQYRTVEVDGMYYVALRNRGADKILKEGKLQEGLYDLALAERFGPLDGDANGYRVWANLYLTGASYWKVDWEKAAYYFGQIYPAYPGLRDSSGLTATERFRLATIGIADQLAAAGKNCEAEKQYRTALDLSPDASVDPKLNDVANKCAAANAPPTQAPTQATTPQTPAETATTPPSDNPQPTATIQPPTAEPPAATPEPTTAVPEATTAPAGTPATG